LIRTRLASKAATAAAATAAAHNQPIIRASTSGNAKKLRSAASV